MDLVINAAIIILEAIYYGLFMNFSKDDKKAIRYILLFIFIGVVGIFLNLNNIINYVILIFLILCGMKYFVKVKTYVYDIFTILLMMFFKIIIEGSLYNILIGKLNLIVTTLIFEAIKILFVFIISKYLNRVYVKGLKIWKNNNFYIRYITSILLIIYSIVSILIIK